MTTVDEFTKLFGKLNLNSKVFRWASSYAKYGESFSRINPTVEEELSDLGLKLWQRVTYAPGDEPEYNPELVPGDVGTIVGVGYDGIWVRWDRLNKDIAIYNGELGEPGILEQLADMASVKESYPMTKRAN